MIRFGAYYSATGAAARFVNRYETMTKKAVVDSARIVYSLVRIERVIRDDVFVPSSTERPMDRQLVPD